MNLRFWGGWFLAIACVCIFLTMGCEKGALGVKPAVVMGRLVNKDNVSKGVPNGIVRMVSKEQIGSGELQQGYNFLSTVTDSEGYFVFEKVNPDNVVFEFAAPGYKKVVYPTSEETKEDDGSSTKSIDIESVAVGNGATVDLRNILMEKVSVILPDSINVKFEFVDSATKERIDGNQRISVSFDGHSYSMKAKAWREIGVEGVAGSSKISIGIRNEEEPVVYKSKDMEISGVYDVYQIIELEPVTYDLVFKFDRIPQYIIDSKVPAVVKIFVEDASDSNAPIKIISVTDVNEITDSVKYAVVTVPAIRHPQQVRIRMHGYLDEVLDLSDALAAGQTGKFGIDVNFDLNDGVSGDTAIDFSSCLGVLGMKDNAIRKDVEMNMIGLASGDKAKVSINLPWEGLNWKELPVSSDPRDGCKANSDGAISGVFKTVPTGYDLIYSISVYTAASGSYIITNSGPDGGINVPVPSDDDDVAKTITLDISKMTSSSTGS